MFSDKMIKMYERPALHITFQFRIKDKYAYGMAQVLN